MSRPTTRWIDDPTTLFVLGLTGLVTCQALAPVVWWLASRHLAARQREGVLPDRYAVAARWLGLLGTALLGLALIAVTGVWISATLSLWLQ